MNRRTFIGSTVGLGIGLGTIGNVSAQTEWPLRDDGTLSDATSGVYSVSFSPDSDYLATGSQDENVYIYDANPVSIGVSGFFFNRWNPIPLSVTGREATRNEEMQGEDISDEVSIEVRQ